MDTTTQAPAPHGPLGPSAREAAPAGKLELRDYQDEALGGLRAWLGGNGEGRGIAPVVAMPTGSGKSAVIAAHVRAHLRVGRTVCVLTHRAELVAQDTAAIEAIAPELAGDIGIFSAGLAQRDLKGVTVASVQSLANARNLPAFDAIVIDEAHMVPSDAAAPEARGLYARALQRLAAARPRGRVPEVVGFTATPFRHREGWLWEPPDSIWDGLAHEAAIGPLVAAGWLARLRAIAPAAQIDVDRLRVRAGDYAAGSQGEALEHLLPAIIEGAIAQAESAGVESAMIFTPNVASTKRAAALLEAAGESVVMVLGDTDMKARATAVERYKAGDVRWIASCGTLTTGFDAPATGLIVVARATKSPVLWAQILGRGMRPAEGKVECLVLDHGQNGARLGPLDAIEPTRGTGRKRGPNKGRVCAECETVSAAGARECSGCGAPFVRTVRPPRGVTAQASAAPVLALGDREQVVRERAGRERARRQAAYGPGTAPGAWLVHGARVDLHVARTSGAECLRLALDLPGGAREAVYLRIDKLEWGPVARKYKAAFGEAPPPLWGAGDIPALVADCHRRAQAIVEGELTRDGGYAAWRTTRWREGCAGASASIPPGAIAPGEGAGAGEQVVDQRAVSRGTAAIAERGEKMGNREVETVRAENLNIRLVKEPVETVDVADLNVRLVDAHTGKPVESEEVPREPPRADRTYQLVPAFSDPPASERTDLPEWQREKLAAREEERRNVKFVLQGEETTSVDDEDVPW